MKVVENNRKKFSCHIESLAKNIPIDLTVMMKSAYDVHKYNTGHGSNSAVANEIDKLISDLEEHDQKMKDNLEELESSSA